MEQKTLSNWPVIGHQNIVEYLQNSLQRHKFAHTYLFSGPAKVGKATVAEYFIQALFCLNYQQQDSKAIEPCGECQSCQQFKKHLHPDYFFLQPEDGKKSISIDQVRAWQHSLGNKSFLTKYKIGVIAGAELLTIEAANALLKTIEEPVGNTIIILLTDDLNLLLPTIISRSQVIKFNLVNNDEIYEYLLESGLEISLAKSIAQLSRGLPGQALVYAGDHGSLKDYQESIEQVIGLLSQPVHDRLDYLQVYLRSLDTSLVNYRIQDLLNKLVLIIREILLISSGATIGYNLFANHEQLKILSQKYSVDQLVQTLNKIFSWQSVKAYNPNISLFAEDLLLTV